MAEIDLNHLMEWVGREEQVIDDLSLATANRFAAVLDLDETPAALPMGWHWLYFQPLVPSKDLDTDGHPKRGGFLPPVPLPRRMWAAGDVKVQTPLLIDTPCERHSRIKDIRLRDGSSGPLIFVDIDHTYIQQGETCLKERQNIVYRDQASTQTSPQASKGASVRPRGVVEQALSFDEVALFRYSAVTFNAHRIHHDVSYTREVEGYPNLIVHGPLLATVLAAFACAQNPGRSLCRYEFRALAPTFANEEIFLQAVEENGSVDLSIYTQAGHRKFSAKAEFS